MQRTISPRDWRWYTSAQGGRTVMIKAGAGEVLRLTGLKTRFLGSYTRKVILCGGFFTLTLVVPRYLILGREQGEPATLSLLPFFAAPRQRHSCADLLLRYLWSVLPRALFDFYT